MNATIRLCHVCITLVYNNKSINIDKKRKPLRKNTNP